MWSSSHPITDLQLTDRLTLFRAETKTQNIPEISKPKIIEAWNYINWLPRCLWLEVFIWDMMLDIYSFELHHLRINF